MTHSPSTDRSGILLVVSGPSGSGKTTLCRRLADAGEVSYSISCTTRPPRPGEQNDRDYHFLDRDAFLAKVQAGEFLEYATVHQYLYGTLKNEVLAPIRSGTDVVMDIDVQGAEQIRTCPDPEIRLAFADLFVMPRSEEELRARLEGRGTDSKEVIALRMRNALDEMTHWRNYSWRLLSRTREDDFASIMALLATERLRVSRIQ